MYWNQLLFPSSAEAPRDILSIGYHLQLCLVWCPGCQLCSDLGPAEGLSLLPA